MTTLALALLLAPPPAPPAVPREFRAVWVATVDNIDWPSKRGLPAAQQKSELLDIIDLCARMRLNAIILQIRPATDALYPSKIEPWSEYLTGRQGQPPSPPWDPLKFAVEESHKRGMELHVWLNPYRSKHPSAKGPLAANHIANTHPKVVKTYANMLWMDPGEPVVQRRSLAVVQDVVRRYDIDGVHIDDYFYPYPVKGHEFPDEPSYAAFRARGGKLARDDWRRRNVDTFVRDLYATIKREKRWVKFGISPFGIYRPGIPAGIAAGIDQYAELYADARKWLVEGWCDYYTPQLYWPIAQTKQSYPVLLKWWTGQNPKRRHLWPGNFTGRTMPWEGNWKAKEVLDQIAITRRMAGATGNVHFSMRAFKGNYNKITDALRDGPYAEGAIPPASTWLDGKPPQAPAVSLSRGTPTSKVYWEQQGVEPSMWWVVWTRARGEWDTTVLPGNRSSLGIASAGRRAFDYVGVAAVDRSGNMSQVALPGQ